MIALGWEIHMVMMSPILYQIPCLKEALRQPIVSFMDICFYIIAIWRCSLKARLHMLEEQLGHLIDDMASFSWRSLSCMDATGKVRGNKSVYPCTCLRTNNLWERRTVIFQIFMEYWIFPFSHRRWIRWVGDPLISWLGNKNPLSMKGDHFWSFISHLHVWKGAFARRLGLVRPSQTAQ